MVLKILDVLAFIGIILLIVSLLGMISIAIIIWTGFVKYGIVAYILGVLCILFGYSMRNDEIYNI